ncbi:MAG: hypothetical protein CL583_12335 [Alteromonadaceae bacterium]|uniref:DUF488 domain-containing protein n=2 Tax=Hydrocarboniclastica marina TaxID=2259620 RepID=A0A4P7XG59_9ALTE|nr:hypothetical protein [Alteromonadaceae bacterium]QCF25968.1 DUF488 domain-containing protein [Hydrocarboniclastica marina]
MPEMPSTLWTLGHSSRSWEEFLQLLKSQTIEFVVDVRRFAGSRKHPQFGQDELADRLAEAGVGYLMVEELGGRRKPDPDSANTIWRHPSFRAYADHMETAEYQAGRERLLEKARKHRTAVMCSEAVWWRCHRSMIADDLKIAGVQVLHIMSPTKTVEHPFTAPASEQHGDLVYGPATKSEKPSD